MQSAYRCNIKNPNLRSLGYLIAKANTQDKHDRSAPSHYHWKILKCRSAGLMMESRAVQRNSIGIKTDSFESPDLSKSYVIRPMSKMIIFSNSSILACPDKKEMQQVHIVFNKMSDDYDKLVSLFLKFSLVHDGIIETPKPEVFQMCFSYTLTAKLAPLWNTLGNDYLINNRDFLTSRGPQEGINYHIWSNDDETVIQLKPVKINFIATDEKMLPGELIRVLPSLNKATIEEYCETLPKSANFKCYKDLRRHWKNIHGYRLPEEECDYFTVRFWRGEPLTYPKICVTRNFPIVTPVPKPTKNKVLANFINGLKSRMPHFLGTPLIIQCIDSDNIDSCQTQAVKNISETQAISLCTQTQR